MAETPGLFRGEHDLRGLDDAHHQLARGQIQALDAVCGNDRTQQVAAGQIHGDHVVDHAGLNGLDRAGQNVAGRDFCQQDGEKDISIIDF